MKTLLKITLITILAFAFSVKDARSQFPVMVMDFVNRKVSADGMSWQFDLVAKAGTNYTPEVAAGGLWIALNIRLDLTLPPGVTILNGVCAQDPTYASIGGAVQVSVPGPPGMPGQRELGLTLERADSDPDVNFNEFVRLATYTINFSAPVTQGNPAYPRIEADDFGSTWVHSVDEENLLPIEFVNVEFPLPVKLISFDASSEGGQANLTWKTSEESNSSHFDVQRSKDGKQWATIATVKALGESKIDHTYVASDVNPLSGENLYRLYMVDKDGTGAYSVIRNVKFDSVTKGLYPNPASNMLTIDAPDVTKISEVSIVNTVGLEVFKSVGKPTEKVNVSNFVPGMYIVKVKTTNGEESSYKVLVVK